MFWTRQKQDPDVAPRVAELEKKVRDLEVEWMDWYDKYRRLYARLAKRESRANGKTDGDAGDSEQLEVDLLNEKIRSGQM
jgi:succinate dehydrogenase/fumarate reductase-like Fe-S protein